MEFKQPYNFKLSPLDIQQMNFQICVIQFVITPKNFAEVLRKLYDVKLLKLHDIMTTKAQAV